MKFSEANGRKLSYVREVYLKAYASVTEAKRELGTTLGSTTT